MGNINQTILIRNNIDQLNAPCLEVGAKDYGNTQDIKALLADKGKYVRVDMEPGPTVDVVIDFTEDFKMITNLQTRYSCVYYGNSNLCDLHHLTYL